MFDQKTDVIKKQFTLSKAERLKSRKRIEMLFRQAPSFMLSPYKVFYLFTGKDDELLQAGFGASARTFKKATDRNRIRRLTKEAYRLGKPELAEKLQLLQLNMAIFLVYTSREIPVYEQVSWKMNLILQRLMNLVNEKAVIRP